MPINIGWFVAGYCYCLLITYIFNYKKKKRVKKE